MHLFNRMDLVLPWRPIGGFINTGSLLTHMDKEIMNLNGRIKLFLLWVIHLLPAMVLRISIIGFQTSFPVNSEVFGQ